MSLWVIIVCYFVLGNKNGEDNGAAKNVPCQEKGQELGKVWLAAVHFLVKGKSGTV